MENKAIKYHDNLNGIQYGSDHKLTNNWDPDQEFADNEYVEVYFRIDTPSYHYQNGFATNVAQAAWHKEASRLIKSFGILEDSGWKVENGLEKRAYLYAHPQEISGVVRKKDVRKIAEAISEMQLSSLRWVDLYKTVYLISDAEYEKYLDSKLEEIRKALFEKASTRRTTKYVSALDVIQAVTKQVKLERLGLADGKNGGGGQTVTYVAKVVKQMVVEGYLKPFEEGNNEYIRSLNKTEQRKYKLSL